MKKIRVLLADDSAVVRRLLKDVLEREQDIEVVRLARHGAEAVGFFMEEKPDVVLLDVEMPELDGVQTTRAIRKLDRSVPIIMFSSLTTLGGAATLDALAAGATDYVPKPGGKGHVTAAIKHVQTLLVPKIRSWGQRRVSSQPAQVSVAASENNVAKKKSRSQIRPGVVAVGVSTGGPDVLASFLGEVPRSFALPILVVQHMPPLFTQLLAERLDKSCALEVREATDGVELPLGQGKVWLAPGDKHLTVKRQPTSGKAFLGLNEDPPVHSCRPAVDVLFRSVAEAYQDSSLGIVMTGMGKDGLQGSQSIHDAGGVVLVQDKSSSAVWGMPGEVAQAGLAYDMLPPAGLGREVSNLAESSSKSMAAVN